jgi:hypothetical protein
MNRLQELAGILIESQTTELNELDVSIVSSLAKNIYSDLKKQGKKVGLEFQNQSLADKGKAISVGNTKEAGALMVWYSVEWINVVGFDSEAEAEELVKKYSSNEIEGKVGSVPGSKGFIAMFNLKQEKQRSKYNTSTYKYDKAQNSNDRKRVQELANIPSDVAALGKTQATATTVTNKAKAINNIQEFPGAFENWFKTLGFQPGKISKSAVRMEVEKVLTKLGYK